MKEIAKLKKYILESKTLSESVHYFFDLIDQNILLKASGSRKVTDIKNHPDLHLAINAAIEVTSESLNRKINVLNPVFTEIPSEKFFHGYCTISDHPVPMLILYCADLQVGISAFANLNSCTNFFRFSLSTVNDLKNKH